MTETERSEQQWNRAILALAVRRIASERHSGQWGKGYAKLCKASHILDMLGFDDGRSNIYDSAEVRDTAAAFLRKHRREIARNW